MWHTHAKRPLKAGCVTTSQPLDCDAARRLMSSCKLRRRAAPLSPERWLREPQLQRRQPCAHARTTVPHQRGELTGHHAAVPRVADPIVPLRGEGAGDNRAPCHLNASAANSHLPPLVMPERPQGRRPALYCRRRRRSVVDSASASGREPLDRVFEQVDARARERLGALAALVERKRRLLRGWWGLKEWRGWSGWRGMPQSAGPRG